jgi:3-(3-hydroxy-phenyl)propionate hydroxylase
VLLRVPELWRVLVPAAEAAEREKLMSDETLQGVLQRVVPQRRGASVAHRSLYHVHQRVAQQFRPGCCSPGDAAHVSNPLGAWA